MKNKSVRLISVEINNFKNVVHGEIKFEDSKNSDCSVLGLYYDHLS